jgi:MraZ protein
MFVGNYTRNLDNKGRIFLPPNFRDELTRGVAILSKGFDEKCLFIYSIEGWNELIKTITSKVSMAKSTVQKFSRWFYSSANEVPLDSQGRIKIDKSLVDHACIKKEVVLLGVSSRAEIWAKELLDPYLASAEKEFLGNKEAFENLGF